MKRLNIFTVATNVYKNYIDILYRSIENIKELTSDYQLNFVYIADSQISLSPISTKVTTNYIHVAHYPYPFNSYLTFALLDDAIKELNIKDDELFIFVDADSFFMKKPEGFYIELLKQCENNNKLTFPISPWGFSEYVRYENEGNSKNASYINNCNYDKYIQGSLYFGLIQKLKEFSERANSLIKYISVHDKQIPTIHNQSIINKIVLEDINNYIVDDFIFNAYEQIDPIANPEVIYSIFSGQEIRSCRKHNRLNQSVNHFLIQKYNTKIKDPLKFIK